jgi:hypothetical protein
MNLNVLFGDGAITRKKMTETLHRAQFPVFFLGGGGDTPSPNKKLNSFLKSLM